MLTYELSADQQQKAKIIENNSNVKLGNKASAKKQLEAALEIDSKIDICTTEKARNYRDSQVSPVRMTNEFI